MKLAIVTFDMNFESFLFNIIKRELGLPCERISSVLDETWEREYGVLFPTSTAQPVNDSSYSWIDTLLTIND